MMEVTENIVHFEKLRSGNVTLDEIEKIFNQYIDSKTHLGRSILHELALSSLTPLSLLKQLADYENQMVRDTAKINLMKHKVLEIKLKEASLPKAKSEIKTENGPVKNKKSKKRKNNGAKS